MKHKFFMNVDWELVKNKKLDPPIKPIIEDKFDISNFNTKHHKEG